MKDIYEKVVSILSNVSDNKDFGGNKYLNSIRPNHQIQIADGLFIERRNFDYTNIINKTPVKPAPYWKGYYKYQAHEVGESIRYKGDLWVLTGHFLSCAIHGSYSEETTWSKIEYNDYSSTWKLYYTCNYENNNSLFSYKYTLTMDFSNIDFTTQTPIQGEKKGPEFSRTGLSHFLGKCYDSIFPSGLVDTKEKFDTFVSTRPVFYCDYYELTFNIEFQSKILRLFGHHILRALKDGTFDLDIYLKSVSLRDLVRTVEEFVPKFIDSDTKNKLKDYIAFSQKFNLKDSQKKIAIKEIVDSLEVNKS